MTEYQTLSAQNAEQLSPSEFNLALYGLFAARLATVDYMLDGYYYRFDSTRCYISDDMSGIIYPDVGREPKEHQLELRAHIAAGTAWLRAYELLDGGSEHNGFALFRPAIVKHQMFRSYYRSLGVPMGSGELTLVGTNGVVERPQSHPLVQEILNLL